MDGKEGFSSQGENDDDADDDVEEEKKLSVEPQRVSLWESKSSLLFNTNYNFWFPGQAKPQPQFGPQNPT